MSADRRRQGFAKAKQAVAKGRTTKNSYRAQPMPSGAAWEKPNGDDPRSTGGYNAQPAPGGFSYGADPRRGLAKSKAQGTGKSYKGRRR